MAALSLAGLADLPSNVLRPNYDRGALSPGIVHIGVGNFHRAHQSWYLHRLMQDGRDYNWAIVGAGVRPYDAAMREKLLAQDCLTTLIELGPSSSQAEVVGSMIDYLPIESRNSSLIETMSDPAIRIVSLTVTEGGYYIDPATGQFDEAHEDILHDAANPAAPRTAFGAITRALAVRRHEAFEPFSVQSCDNLLGNGDVVKGTVVSLARLNDPSLADWIEDEVAFPNSMVDSIVPATGNDEIALARSMGIDDAVPVTHENFRQWVIEDRFSAGRPEWEAAGATLTSNVHAYEDMKIRVLNAGHQMIANAGEILSFATIADCMSDPIVSGFLRKAQTEDVLPYVNPVPEMSTQAYLQLVEARFSNPAIHDTTRRVAYDGSARHTGFVLPTLRDALGQGGSVRGLALTEALWARMCQGVREDGTQIEPNDPFWPDLVAAAERAQNDPEAWLHQDQFYGAEANAPAFRDAFVTWMKMLSSDGCRATIRAYLSGD